MLISYKYDLKSITSIVVKFNIPSFSIILGLLASNISILQTYIKSQVYTVKVAFFRSIMLCLTRPKFPFDKFNKFG